MRFSLIITCEHAGNEVPDEYVDLFLHQHEMLNSHRGWDPGAYNIAEFIAENLNCSLHSCHITRLLIETNRSRHHVQLFSEFSKNLPDIEKEKLVTEVYEPYRQAVIHEIFDLPKPVLHLSIHSFTPVFNGEVRNTHIGILFDPDRTLEAGFCEQLKTVLMSSLSFNIDFNKPYQGTDDGFTTYLRKQFRDEDYLGIEIEVNQKFNAAKEFTIIQAALANAILQLS